MSEKQNAIRNAARAVKAHGLALPSDLEKQIEGLENPQYRVAVVGKYQVGKSTLINRVFLGDKPLLEEGRGLCTTAVATDVEYGPAPKLSIYDWTDAGKTAETLAATIENPSVDAVSDATVASAMETRGELAAKRSRVSVQVPNDALRGYTVCDTPGLDDPNQELLLNTTWRIIPGADVALLVVEGDRQLGDNELKLLRKEIMGKNGIARLMVLASFKSGQMLQDAEGRRDILDTIKAQLANIGRENIPVEMYCFDPAIEDIMSDVAEIRMTIRSFLSENALPGREEKVANLLRAEIEKDLVEIAARIKTAETSEAEREALKEKVDREVERFKEKAERSFDGFQDGLATVRARMTHDVDMAVEGVFAKFVTELEKQDSVKALQAVLGRAGQILRSDLQDKLSVVGLALRQDLDRLMARYAADLEAGGRDWQLFLSEEFNVKTGFVAKIPPFAIDIVNVLVLNVLLPGGWIPAILTNLIGKKFLNPVEDLAKAVIVAQAKTGLKEAQPEVHGQIMDQIDGALQNTLMDVKAAMESSNKAQVAAIRAALDGRPADAADRAALESAKADLETVLATL